MSNNDKPFSERMGLVSPKAMQVNDLDKAARVALFNDVSEFIEKSIDSRSLFMEIGTKFLSMPRHSVLVCDLGIEVKLTDKMREAYGEIYNGEWYRIFELIEFIYLHFNYMSPHIALHFLNTINKDLKQENVGYRFIDGKFIRITNEGEMQAIEQAATIPYEKSHRYIKKATDLFFIKKHKIARIHIKKSISLFADRQNPDYANIIKESISAVESLAKEITGENNFDKAINKLKENGVKLHPQFEKAIKNMYHFTSDDDGIRHGGTGEPLQVNQATAHYMLVVCSAIVNFIIASKTAKP